MMNTAELREEAQAISWWLAPENALARKELEQRNPPLGQWLDKVEAMVKAKLAEREAQAEKEGEIKV
jgi:hypothetical protein